MENENLDNQNSEIVPPLHTATPQPPNIVIHQDHSSFPLIVTLDETNYPLWSQLMDMRIGARNKSGFLTGATPKPNLGDPSLDSWITNNKHATSKTLYDGSDESCLFDLNQRSFTTKQLGRPLAVYYNELLAIFQEIDHRTSPSDSVTNLVHQQSTLSRFRVHIFLAGLDSEFDQGSYAYVRRDSQQRLTMSHTKTPSNASALLTHSPRISSPHPPRPRRDSAPPTRPSSFLCSHYGEVGHSKQRCYELIGYPDWWDFTKRPRKKIPPRASLTVADAEQSLP
ncbi:uncharacterized protein LOC133309809 [Gastrolobium bilobum]|uniref:uncharacterized protein LOC133309809 n=1 Tax=Gastrolobium bilobum TaxID=150636 RepID=UPI002AB1B48E|nr:uncharacterized protein LOC133309809 [Gastrolobium bilobum]